MANITYANIYSAAGNAEEGAAFEGALAKLRERADVPVLGHHIGASPDSAGTPFERTDPVDPSRVIARAVEADASVVDRAVSAARDALPGWRRREYLDRVRLLQSITGPLAARRIELAALISFETGKTRGDALAEVDECVAILDLFAAQATESGGYVVDLVAPTASSKAGVSLRPYGVFGVIAPFNFPLAISFTMVAAALIAGNTVVYKPSALTPGCGEAFFELFADLDLPPGVLNLVQGGGATGGCLAEAAVDGVAFTGSAEVGLGLIERLSRPPFMRPVLAEMGGKNPAIISAHAGPLDVAATAVARSAFGMSGQKCNACSRAVVVDAVYDEFVEALAEATDSLTVGDPIDAGNFTGPVVSSVSVNRYHDAVAAARADGRLVTGEREIPHAGCYVPLTVVDRLPIGHSLTREELFLPVLSVIRVDDLDAAIEEANAIRYGLSAGIFTQDAGERERFLDEIEAGIVFVNNPGGATTGVWPGSQTMSGWKGSGSAGKGGFGPWYLQQFSREQSRTVFEATP